MGSSSILQFPYKHQEDRNLATCYYYVSQSMLYKECSSSVYLSLGKAELTKSFA